MSCVISGESVDDCGGGYSESIAEMCDELQNCSLLPLLIATPNGREESGTSRDDAMTADYSFGLSEAMHDNCVAGIYC